MSTLAGMHMAPVAFGFEMDQEALMSYHSGRFVGAPKISVVENDYIA